MGRRIIRYAAALVLLIYAFAKINGSQFTILDSELDKPLGQVSGFWLTWYYFGFSRFYEFFIALVELSGALLLTFDRTTLLGACMLTPVLANIILIDIFYGVDLGAAVVAMVLLAAMLALIARHARELAALFYPAKEGLKDSNPVFVGKWALRLAMLGLAFGFTYWEANFNNRLPTPIDGAWAVVQAEPQNAAAQLPSTIFFEYNRAYMTIFKTSDGAYSTHHFELDRSVGQIRIWETWLVKGRQIFEGRYTLADRVLTLNGSWEGLGSVILQLRRR